MMLTFTKRALRGLFSFALAQLQKQQRRRALPTKPAVVRQPPTILDLSPVKQEPLQVAEQTAIAMVPPPAAPAPPAPDRAALVEGLLDEAWAQGLRTYPQLIKYVELQTGTGCSRRSVVRWKQSHGLRSVAQAA